MKKEEFVALRSTLGNFDIIHTFYVHQKMKERKVFKRAKKGEKFIKFSHSYHTNYERGRCHNSNILVFFIFILFSHSPYPACLSFSCKPWYMWYEWWGSKKNSQGSATTVIKMNKFVSFLSCLPEIHTSYRIA